MKKQLLALSMIATSGLMAGNSSATYENMQQDCCSPCCNNPRPCVDSECYIPAFHNLQCDCGFFFDVEFLYWYSRQNTAPYARRFELISDGSETSTPPSTVEVTRSLATLDESWDPGVRVGLGWNMGCDGWDLSLFWTYYKNTSSESFSIPEFAGDYPISLGDFGIEVFAPTFGDTINAFSSLRSKWTNRFNEIDFVLGKKVWWSHCFAIRPYAGLRGAWTRTRFEINGQDGPKGDSNYLKQVSNRFEDKIWGVGFVGGIDPTFYFTDCFAIYANLGFSVQWGKFEEKNTGSVYIENDNTSGINANYSNNYSFEYYLMSSILDTGLGLRWESTWCDCQYRSNFDIGWEHHIWMPHSGRVGDVNADLGYGGLVVRVRFDF
jgi:hypothetical protein